MATLNWSRFCLCHQAHLGVEQSLKMSDFFLKSMRDRGVDAYGGEKGGSFRYYGTLAKITNLWRENVKSVFTTWARLFGAPAARDHAFSVPPRCLCVFKRTN
jgi:hypothetical protein